MNDCYGFPNYGSNCQSVTAVDDFWKYDVDRDAHVTKEEAAEFVKKYDTEDSGESVEMWEYLQVEDDEPLHLDCYVKKIKTAYSYFDQVQSAFASRGNEMGGYHTLMYLTEQGASCSYPSAHVALVAAGLAGYTEAEIFTILNEGDFFRHGANESVFSGLAALIDAGLSKEQILEIYIQNRNTNIRANAGARSIFNADGNDHRDMNEAVQAFLSMGFQPDQIYEIFLLLATTRSLGALSLYGSFVGLGRNLAEAQADPGTVLHYLTTILQTVKPWMRDNTSDVVDLVPYCLSHGISVEHLLDYVSRLQKINCGTCENYCQHNMIENYPVFVEVGFSHQEIIDLLLGVWRSRSPLNLASIDTSLPDAVKAMHEKGYGKDFISDIVLAIAREADDYELATTFVKLATTIKPDS